MSQAASVFRFTGAEFINFYDSNRPGTPSVLIDITRSFSKQPSGVPFDVVVDLGAGSGLSTIVWNGSARCVYAVEPSPDMRAICEKNVATLSGSETKYIVMDGLSTAIPLPDNTADVVTVSQALHWMDPQPTFAEISRVLKPGGVFVTYDYDQPPTINWEIDKLYIDLKEELTKIENTHQHLFSGLKKYEKTEHLSRIIASNHFRFVKEVTLHSIEKCDAERYINLALSQGNINTLLKNGVDFGFDKYKETLKNLMDQQSYPMYLSYRVRLAIK